MALASVINVLVLAVLLMVFISPLGASWGLNVASIVSALTTGLFVGILFAGQIWKESRMKAIGKIAVLAAFVQMFFVLIGDPINSYYGAYAKERLQGMFQTGSWTTADWYVYEGMWTLWTVALTVFLALVFGFIGVYVGSMLRKPKKT